MAPQSLHSASKPTRTIVAVAALLCWVSASSCPKSGPPEPTNTDGGGTAASPDTGNTSPDAGAATHEQRVGQGGGTLSFQGATLVIPPGALAAEQSITIRVADAEASLGALSRLYSLEPHGLAFAKPIEVTFETTASAATGALYWSSANGDLVEFREVEAQWSSGSVSATVSHFSFVFVGTKSSTGVLWVCRVVENSDNDAGFAFGTCPNGYKFGGASTVLCGWYGPTVVLGNGWLCYPTCDATTCPSGCCDAKEKCQAGTDSLSCGKGGQACVKCSGSTGACGPDHACVACDPTNCAAGCCDTEGVCRPGSEDGACGTKGAACKACTGSEPKCSQAKICAADCGGTACGTTCDPSTCTMGCCTAAGQCVAGDSDLACGFGGLPCQACSGATPACLAASLGYQCQARPPTCDYGTCPDGCCSAGGTCEPGTANGACGSYGNACAVCSSDTPYCATQRVCAGCESAGCPLGEACGSDRIHCVPCPGACQMGNDASWIGQTPDNSIYPCTAGSNCMCVPGFQAGTCSAKCFVP